MSLPCPLLLLEVRDCKWTSGEQSPVVLTDPNAALETLEDAVYILEELEPKCFTLVRSNTTLLRRSGSTLGGWQVDSSSDSVLSNELSRSML